MVRDRPKQIEGHVTMVDIEAHAQPERGQQREQIHKPQQAERNVMAQLFFMPLISTVWGSPQTRYRYLPVGDDGKGGFGEFGGLLVSASPVFAPESGLLVAAGDGTFILQANDGDITREWFFVSKLKFEPKTDTVVRGGAQIGISDGSLQLALVTGPKGGKLDPVDPAQFLIANKAAFVDKLSPGEAGRRQVDPGAHAAAVAAAKAQGQNPTSPNGPNSAASPSSELATTTPDDISGKKTFSAPIVVGMVAGATLTGFTIAWLMKGK